MKRPPRFEGWIIAAVLLAAMWGSFRLGVRPQTFRDLLDAGPSLAKYTHPDGQDLPHLFALMYETVVMGIWGTAIAFFIAIPLAAMAAKNLSPNSVSFRCVREFFNFCRSMPDALLALVFIQGFGLGPTAGAIALGFHTSGYLGKVLAENMERVSPGVYEGLAACGATRSQIVRFGAWPSIEREVVGMGFYLLDRNIRVATTLGLVGAGGIGGELLASLRTFNQAHASTSIALVFVLVLLVDSLSGFLRRTMN